MYSPRCPHILSSAIYSLPYVWAELILFSTLDPMPLLSLAVCDLPFVELSISWQLFILYIIQNCISLYPFRKSDRTSQIFHFNFSTVVCKVEFSYQVVALHFTVLWLRFIYMELLNIMFLHRWEDFSYN